MKQLKMILIIASLIFLSGCWDSEESVRMLYVHGVGIDYKEDEFHVYVQLVSFANVARSEQINQDVMQSEVGFIKGKTIDEAFEKLYRSVDEKLFFGHLTFLIFSEELLKEAHLNEVLNSFTRYINTRYQTWVYATDEPLEQIFIETPILRKAITLTKLANPLNSYEQDSFIEPINVRKLIIQLNEPSHIVLMPYVTEKENWHTERGVDASYNIEGVALVTPTGFKGYLKKDAANGLQWITNESITNYLSTKIDGSDFTFSNKNKKVKIVPKVDGTNVKFDINISVSTIVNSFDVNVSENAIRQAVKKGIEKEVLETYKLGLEKNSDVYRLSEVLYRKHVGVWKKLQKNGVIPLTEDSVNVNVIVDKVRAGRTMYKNTINHP